MRPLALVAFLFVTAARNAAALQGSPCDDLVTITLGANQFHPNGAGRCDVMNIDVDPATVCPGGWLTWKIENGCDRKVKLRIGKRRPKYPKDAHGEVFATTDDLRPAPYPVPAHGRAELKVQVSPRAKERGYKYDITGDGDIATDPEIDVRRGGGGMPPPPPPQPRPSPSPSPSGNAPHP